MKKIAFTASSDNGRSFIYDRYISAVSTAGKAGNILPVILPTISEEEKIRQYAELFDGFVFSGGDDISPDLFGEKKHSKCGSIDRRRDFFEISLCRAAIKQNKSVLGICRGIQIIAVANGGTLWQDIPSQVENAIQHSRQTPSDTPHHSVAISGVLREIFGINKISVNSYHHQAVRSTGSGIEVCATSSDGIIEAIVLGGSKFCIGVQWHPELYPDMYSVKLFDAFLLSL